ncbi:MAG: bifunctional enoyl-CoA hydratase/phosphate acetyltransferase [Hyphomicrobiaceae bacterium]
MTLIENRTWDEIKVGDRASLSRTLSRRDIELFAVMSGDVNPAHVDDEFARSDMFHKIIAHGMWAASLISTVLGTELPGPGTIYVDQSLHFCHPVAPGDTVVVTVVVREKDGGRRHVKLDCSVVDQAGKQVIAGTATVLAPTEKVARPRVVLPDIRIEERGARLRKLIIEAQKSPPMRTAVVAPTDTVSLSGAVESAREHLIIPTLIGPAEAIRQAARAAKLDILAFEIVPTATNDLAASKAVELAATGKVDALMKGALHTDALMHAVVASAPNLRTERRISHVFVMDVPSYPRALLITDAAINIYPDLDTKRDIIDNAIRLAHALGVPSPKVAILSAVETVNAKIRSTLEAAALCKMADRGQIAGGIVDGPLAFDNAVNLKAAQIKHIHSAVAGQADILVVPDLEAGNMLAKQLEYLADAEAAGVVLGARVPIILTSRADSAKTRLASSAIAVLLSNAIRQPDDKVQAALTAR